MVEEEVVVINFVLLGRTYPDSLKQVTSTRLCSHS